MIPNIGRRTALKALGVASVAGLFSSTASADASQTEQRGDDNTPNAPVRTPRFVVELELNGEPVEGWSEIQLPSTRTEPASGEDEDGERDVRRGRTEWDDLTMSRGAKQGEKMLWDWYEDVMKGEVKKKKIGITLLDRDGEPVARYEFRGAWPTEYSPPELDASAVGGDSAMGQEELTIAYDKYKRTE